jgi:hypothetical protein
LFINYNQLVTAPAFTAKGNKIGLKAALSRRLDAGLTIYYQTKEMAKFAALASLNGAGPQLGFHIDVGKNTGLSYEQVPRIAVPLGAKVGKNDYM